MQPPKQIEIDRTTSSAILREFGERLQQTLPPAASLPLRLDHLIAELRKRDAKGDPSTS